MNITLLIIAGGQSSRLGVDKRFVEVGGVGLPEKILRKVQAIDFAEKFLCVQEELPALKILAARSCASLTVDKLKGAEPLAAFYRQELADFFSREILSGQRKILSAIKKNPARLRGTSRHRKILQREHARLFEIGTRQG